MPEVDFVSLLKPTCKACDPLPVEHTNPVTLLIAASDLLPVCTFLTQSPSTYFDMLSCVTGIDNGPEATTMEVVYHLYSIPFNYSLALKVVLPRQNPEVASICEIWRSANWLEREVFDMYGIIFTDHPDLRRILMPADWKGFPLRKDYQHEDQYRDIKIKY